MQSSAELAKALDAIASRAASGEQSLGDAIESLQDASFCLVGLIVCLPFLFPLPLLGPLTIPGGLAIAALGWQMFRGAEQIRLPSRFAKVKLGASAWKALATACQRLLRVCQRFARPRLQHWVSGTSGERMAGLFVLIGGALLAIPMGGMVPFNNTLPALIAVCACVALLEQDGLWFLFSVFWLVATLLYFALIAYLLIYAGAEFKAWLGAHLPSWL
jgi:hypothetical protein